MMLLLHQREIARKLAFYREFCLIKFKHPEMCGYAAVYVCLNRKQMTGKSPYLMTCTIYCTYTQPRQRGPERLGLWVLGG